MFGTLTYDLQRKEPLTFVENPNPGSALSRSRRDKPHISCEFCRTRKVRCSGQPSGCDRCVAVSAECRYPDREPRRRKFSRRIGRSTPSSNTSSAELGADSKDRSRERQTSRLHDHAPVRGPSPSQQQRHDRDKQEQPSTCAGSDQMELVQAQAIGGSVRQSDSEQDQDFGQQQMDYWLSSYTAGDMSLSNDLSCGLEEWLDVDSCLDQMPSAHVGGPYGRMDTAEDPIGISLLGDADSLDGFGLDEIDNSAWSSSSPSPLSLAQTLLPSPTLTVPPSRGQSAASNNNKIMMKRQESQNQTSGFGNWSDQSCITLKQIQRTPDQSKCQETSLASAAQLVASTTALPERDPSITTGVHIAERCHCLHLTACLLEELAAKCASNDQTAMDVLLGYFRGALIRCTTISDCERCASLGENNMLLAIAAQYMSTICERIIRSYVGLRRAQDQQHNQHQRSLSNLADLTSNAGRGNSEGQFEKRINSLPGMASRTGSEDMWFSTYRIESSSERMQVLRCLVTVQLTEFSRLLEKLKVRAGSQRGHLVPLADADKKMKAVRSMLRASLDRFGGHQSS